MIEGKRTGRAADHVVLENAVMKLSRAYTDFQKIKIKEDTCTSILSSESNRDEVMCVHMYTYMGAGGGARTCRLLGCSIECILANYFPIA